MRTGCTCCNKKATVVAPRFRACPAFVTFYGVMSGFPSGDRRQARALGTRVHPNVVTIAAWLVGLLAAVAAGAALIGTFYVNAASWMYLAAILERCDLGASVTGERATVIMPPGFIAGAETFVFYCLVLLFPAYLPVLSRQFVASIGENFGRNANGRSS